MSAPVNLRSVLTKALLRPVGLALGGLVVVLAASPWLGGDEHLVVQQDPVRESTAQADPALQRAARLMDRHDCWAGEAPADMQGVLPGHVVVTHRAESGPHDGTVRTTYAGERMVGRTLEHLFGDEPDPGIVTVHGYCR